MDKKKPRVGRHPMQPIQFVGNVIRFKQNAIVRLLIDTHPTIDMNTLACMELSQADRNQFAQLIGYSVSGFGELSYAFPSDVAEADSIADALSKKKRGKKC